MAVTAPPANPPEVDDGVIEEARRRQRRRRGRAGALVLATAAIASGLALVRGGVGDGGTYPNVGAVRGSSGPLRLAFVRGLPYLNGQPFPLSVTPSLKAGSVGVTVMTPTVGGSVPYPAVSTPLWGDEGSYEAPVVPAPGEIDYALAAPRVAAVRVAGIGTFKPVALPGLPPGVRLVVFSRTAGSRGIVLPPDPPPDVGTWIPPALRHTPLITMTPLDLQGHVIPSSTSRGQPAFQLPYTYWQVTGTRRKTCKVLPGQPSASPQGQHQGQNPRTADAPCARTRQTSGCYGARPQPRSPPIRGSPAPPFCRASKSGTHAQARPSTPRSCSTLSIRALRPRTYGARDRCLAIADSSRSHLFSGSRHRQPASGRRWPRGSPPVTAEHAHRL